MNEMREMRVIILLASLFFEGKPIANSYLPVNKITRIELILVNKERKPKSLTS